MALAEIQCTCGHRFEVTDAGEGAPHACPACRMQNVLPRRANGSSSSAARVELGRTAVRTTDVLTTGAPHRLITQGLPEGTMLGPYRIVRRIGRGGMSTVYEATDERGGQRVALKVLAPELVLKPDFVARFHRESRALNGVSDERIAKVYFSGAADGLPFFAMEYVDGRNLEQVLQTEGPFPPQRAIRLMREAARGLEAAADRGIIHRDVKPTNLLLDQRGRLRIVDFGLAKAVDSESRLTLTGAVVGTPFYLSPEQGLGKGVDQRSDIYSLGATFYHLMTGTPPFNADSPVSIIMKHINDAPPSIVERLPRVPENLGRIVMRCLAKEPKRRYQDYADLIADLDAAERGEPVSAPPIEVSARRRKPSFVVVDDLDDGSRLLRRASITRRVFASAFDAGVLWLMLKVLQQLLPLAYDPLAFFVPCALLYVMFGDASGGNTLGKRLLRLRVAKPDGTDPNLVRGVLRALLLVPVATLVLWLPGNGVVIADHLMDRIGRLPFASTLEVDSYTVRIAVQALMALAFIDLAAVLFTSRGQSLHDLLSLTAVFREDRVRRPRRPLARADGKPMSPYLPLALSVIPGMGQLINGDMGRALLAFIVITIGFSNGVLGLLAWGLAAYEAYYQAARRRSAWEAEQARRGVAEPKDW